MNTFWLVAAASLVLICLAFVFYLYRAHALLSAHYHQVRRKLYTLQNIYHFGPELACYWYEGEQNVECSHELCRLLKLAPHKPMRIDDLTKILGPTSFSPFQKGLNHIHEFGGDFTIHLTALEGEVSLVVHGRKIIMEDAPSRTPNTVIVLSFANFTPLLNEQLLQTQAVQLKELDNLRILCDLVPIALWARDKHGRVAYCNATYAGALDTSVHRVIAENKELVISNSNHYGTYELFHRALESRQSQNIRTHVVIGGERRLIELAEVPIPEAHRTIGYAFDITEMEEVENKLETINRAQREVLDLLSTAIMIFGPDRRLIYYNVAYERLFEHGPSWLDTKPTLSEVLDNLRERRKIPEYADFQKHKKERLHLFNNLFQPLHEMLYQPDGRVLRMVISPHPLGGIMYMFDDITDTLALERGYKTLMAVQRETLDNLYEGIIVFGTDSRLRLLNPSFLHIWGLVRDDVQGTPHINDILSKISHRFTPQHQGDFAHQKIQALLQQRQTCQGTIYLVDDITLQYTYVPLPDGSCLISFVDISDQRRIERTLKERAQDLENTQRLKNNFISHVSYELKAPLNTIAGFSEILVNGYFGDMNEKQLDYCKGIAESADKLMNLINDMIDLANIEAGTLNLEPAPISLQALITSALALIQNRASDQGLELITHINLNQDTLCVDTKRLKHALFNVLSNAVKFTPAGGSITLNVQENLLTPGYIDMVITDTGIGIREADRERIFHLFEHGNDTHNLQRGAGIGLAIAKRLVELHKGTLSLTSTEGKGTCVCISLPRDAQHLPEVVLADQGIAAVHAAR
jgi:signal transduction histidine kinase